MNEIDILIRFGLAIIFGGLIGFERVISNHDAGLRTHILVSLGSASVMILGQLLVTDYGGDVSRIGAQVVSGIGFLGAGCILVNGNKIKGLTTAAGLWTTACVGLILGSGYYFAGISLGIIMLVSMLILHPISNWLQKRGENTKDNIRFTFDETEPINKVLDAAYKLGLSILDVQIIDFKTVITFEYTRDKQIKKFLQNINDLKVITDDTVKNIQ